MSKKFFILVALAILSMILIYTAFPLSSIHEYIRLDPATSRIAYASPRTNSTGNFPDFYFNNALKKPAAFNSSCARFPELFDIKVRNDHWQVQKTSNGTFHLFNAYLDRRNGSLVRILGTYNQYLPQEKFFCQLWYDKAKPEVVPTQILLWVFHPKWGADSNRFNHPYLITCPLIDERIPISVSLVQNPCDNPTNNLKIFYKKVEKKKNFVVCVKGLSFPYEDNSVRIAEWIELLNLLGAEKVNFYEFSVHANTRKVLDYYVGQKKIEVTPLTLVGDVSNVPFLQSQYLQQKIVGRRLQEVIPYNDCLYKHTQEFKFVVLLDTDEVIVPVNDTWVELMQTLQNESPKKSSYMARNVYFLDSYLHEHDWFDGIPKYMHMLQHVYRARDYTKRAFYVKGFHDVEMVVTLHNHYPFSCFKACKDSDINTTLAHLQHYRVNCSPGVDCSSIKVDSIRDTRVWRFKDELIKRVESTMRYLKLLDG